MKNYILIKKRYDLKHFRRKIKSKEKKRLRNVYKNNITKTQKRERLIESHLKKDSRSYTYLKAPAIFSLLDNTEKVVAFIREVDKCFEKRNNIFIEMTHVQSIAYGAIVVLLSKLVQFKSKQLQVNGSFPLNKKAKRILRESGFIEYLYKKHVEDKNEYYINEKICTHANIIVDPILSNSIIEHASQILWGDKRRCTGLQRVFLELMQNTNNHASEKNGEKLWWSSIVPVRNKNGEVEKICFSFIDYGVGIFSSLSNKKQGKFVGIVNKLKEALLDIDDANIMRLLLRGEIHKIADRTATGLSYRGKGLPGIYGAMIKNDISHLKIISNHAYADVANDKYLNLKNVFSGTYVYWELVKTNNNFNV
jgi:hypothetical protein